MKYVTLLLCLLLSCSNVQEQDISGQCRLENYDQLQIEDVQNLLLGDWHYVESFADSCFYIKKLGDLPKKLSFKKIDTRLIKDNNPRLYGMGIKMDVFGLESSHDSKPFGDKSYVIARTISVEDKKIMQVMHYDLNGIGKSYAYYLEYVGLEVMVIRNQRYYTIDQGKVSGVSHIYRKKK